MAVFVPTGSEPNISGLILCLLPANEIWCYNRFAPSQWETSLQSNAISHWLGANLQSALNIPTLQLMCKVMLRVSVTAILQIVCTSTISIKAKCSLCVWMSHPIKLQPQGSLCTQVTWKLQKWQEVIMEMKTSNMYYEIIVICSSLQQHAYYFTTLTWTPKMHVWIRAIRMPSFWEYALLTHVTHTFDSCQISSQQKTKSKLQI